MHGYNSTLTDFLKWQISETKTTTTLISAKTDFEAACMVVSTRLAQKPLPRLESFTKLHIIPADLKP